MKNEVDDETSMCKLVVVVMRGLATILGAYNVQCRVLDGSVKY